MDWKRRVIVLLGAGFSANWGGFLARQLGPFVSAKLRPPYREVLRKSLLRDEDYEQAWADIISCSKQDKRDAVREALEDALVETFEFQERLLAEGMRYWRHNTPLGRFLMDFTNSVEAGHAYIVTTNQDTALERIFEGIPYLRAPGVAARQVQQHQIVSRSDYTQKLPDYFDPSKPNQSKDVAFIKLHGSFNWINGSRRAMITGKDKDNDIDAIPYLRQAREWLERELACQDTKTDLLIIGHSLGSDSIGSILNAACNRQWRTFVVDPSSPASWISQNERHSQIVTTLEAYVPYRITDIFTINQEMPVVTEFLRSPLGL